MYRIILGQDGKYYCEGRLQDGTERHTAGSLEAAVEWLKKFAKAANGEKLKKKKITYWKEQQVVRRELTPWYPYGEDE